jgi:hypothetical protein
MKLSAMAAGTDCLWFFTVLDFCSKGLVSEISFFKSTDQILVLQWILGNGFWV